MALRTGRRLNVSDACLGWLIQQQLVGEQITAIASNVCAPHVEGSINSPLVLTSRWEAQNMNLGPDRQNSPVWMAVVQRRHRVAYLLHTHRDPLMHLDSQHTDCLCRPKGPSIP